MTTDFQRKYNGLLMDMRFKSQEVPQAVWQSKDVSSTPGMTFSRELRHVTFKLSMTDDERSLQLDVQPNLPWAEDHFLERVSGEPLNPPPSEAWWPYRVKQNADHKEVQGQKFSHTYPERMWPRFANSEAPAWARMGIRYELGDLGDVVRQLVNDPLTRQAYLPIWFPEDTGVVKNQRVPCTLGYHFLFRPDRNRPMALNGEIVYYIRSCDLFRHFTDDVYMAGRLLQWVVGKLRERDINAHASSLIMHISSLHTFEGDDYKLKQLTDRLLDEEDNNYGAAV